MRHPTPYADLNAVLQELVTSAQAILGYQFIGAYLQGSFACGDFDIHSDVDWTMVTDAELSKGQVQALQGMHERIYRMDCSWAQHLEGSYFPKDLLKRSPIRGERLWFLDHGSQNLIESDHCNTLVVRWQLREHGVRLAGPDPESLIDVVPASALRREVYEVMHEWGNKILADPEHYNYRFYQGFIVLSYCRMLQSLHTGDIRSKRAGAEWAKANLDPSWAGLIDRTWATRPNPELSARQPADPQDMAKTLEFVKAMIHQSEKIPM
jgi:hypothetical protein